MIYLGLSVPYETHTKLQTLKYAHESHNALSQQVARDGAKRSSLVELVWEARRRDLKRVLKT